MKSLKQTLYSTAVWFILLLPPDGAFAAEPKLLWTQLIGFQPIDIQKGDVNGDKRPDFAIGYSENAILALDAAGNVLWRFPTRMWVWSVATGDIDDDGRDDVAGFESQRPGFLYALKGTGDKLWEYQLPITGSGNATADHLKIADVTGNGRNEVVVAANGSSEVLVFDQLGSLLDRHQVPSHIPAIELADVSGDRVNDIVVSYGYRCPPCGIQVLSGSGALVWDFRSSDRLGDAAVGDIAGNTSPEVVVGEWLGSDVYAIDHNGSSLWTYSTGGTVNSVALGDIDSDGKLEAIIGSADKHVYALDGNGKLLWKHDVGANITKVDVGNLDGRGADDVAAASLAGGSAATRAGVHAIDSSGKVIWTFRNFLGPLAPLQRGFRDLVVADLDRDGNDEVVAISDSESESGDWDYGGYAYALATVDASGHGVSLVALGDIDNASGQDTAVVEQTDATVKRLNGMVLKQFSFGAGLKPIDVEVMEDINANGAPELVMLGKGSTKAEVRDSLTGQLLGSATFSSSFEPIDLEILPDQNGNGVPELAVLQKGSTRVEIRDGMSGAWIKAISFNGSFIPKDLALLPNVGGTSAFDLAVLHEQTDPNQNDRVEIRDYASKKVVRNVFVGKGFTVKQLEVLEDVNGNGKPELAVLREGSVNVLVKDAGTGGHIRNVGFYAGYTPLKLLVVPDTDNDGEQELGLYAVNPVDGTVKIELRDVNGGQLTKNVWFGKQEQPEDATVYPDINGNGSPEVGALGRVKSNPDQLNLRIKDAKTGKHIKAMVF